MMNPIITQNILLDIIINALVLLGTSQFPFIIGMLFYKYKTITFIRNKISQNNYIAFVIIVLCVILHVVVKSMIIAPFIAIILICGFSLISFNKFFKDVFEYFTEKKTPFHSFDDVITPV